jgi:hypothetical protein
MDARNARKGIAIGIAVVIALVLSTLGGIGFPQTPAAAQYQYEHKVTLCHHAGLGTRVTIMVSESAVAAHLKHGDALGPCP